MKPKLQPVKIKKINEKSFEELALKVKRILQKEQRAAQKESNGINDNSRGATSFA